MYEKPGIQEEHLRACLQKQYDLLAATLEFLPLGLDSKAGVYRITSAHGDSYLLKATLRALYEPSCLVPRYLHDQGITAVVAPLPAKNHTLWTHIDDWTIMVYPFIVGDTSWTGMTDEQWQETGSVFKQIHQATLPAHGFASLRKETFDPTEYAHWIQDFETHHQHTQNDGSTSEQGLRATWLAHQSTIHDALTTMEKLAAVLQQQSGPYVICHADLHPANLLRNDIGQVFVIDWDEVMLAPKERDFLFIKDATTLQETPPFFQGYGQTEINWIALTYYRYERVAQDLIACAQEVLFRDDLGEESKALSFQLFQEVLAPGGEIDTARATAKHLPPGL